MTSETTKALEVSTNYTAKHPGRLPTSSLPYDPYSTTKPFWAGEGSRTSVTYRAAEKKCNGMMESWLRDVALRGEIVLGSIQTKEDRQALLKVAKEHGYRPGDTTRGTSCYFVYIRSNNAVHMRSGSANPYLRSEILRDLHRMQVEQERYENYKAGRHSNKSKMRSTPFVARWCFSDSIVSRDVMDAIRVMGYEVGVFPGVPSASFIQLQKTEGAQLSSVDSPYLYHVEVSTVRVASWDAPLAEVLRSSPGTPEDPYPLPKFAQRDAFIACQYREYLRPFIFNFTPEATRCMIAMKGNFAKGKLPQVVSSLGTACCLRHDVTHDGGVFYRRWTRRLVAIYIEYVDDIIACDMALLQKHLKKVRACGSGESPQQALYRAKEETPYVGAFRLCLEQQYFRRDIGEFQTLALGANSYVYVREHAGYCYIYAMGRDVPRPVAEGYCLYFLPNGHYLGPPEYKTHDMRHIGEANILPTYQHLLESGSHAAAARCARIEDTGANKPSSTSLREGYLGERRPRSPTPSDRGSYSGDSEAPAASSAQSSLPQPQVAQPSQADPQPPLPQMAGIGNVWYGTPAYEVGRVTTAPPPPPGPPPAPQLSARALYDAVAGYEQRSMIRPGFTVETHLIDVMGPQGSQGPPQLLQFVCDHLERKATLSSSR